MVTPPRLRGSLGVRLVMLAIGLFLFAAGTVALLESRLGLAPWDVLHQGIARHTPLSFGEANITVAAVVLMAAWMLGAPIGIGTLANALLVGGFVELLLSLSPVVALSADSLTVRGGLLAAGMVLLGTGTALYLGVGLGAGPRDSLMLVGARRSRVRIGAVRGTIEIAALSVGVMLGGRLGAGTIIFALGIGPAVEATFWLIARSPLAVSQEDNVGSPEAESLTATT